MQWLLALETADDPIPACRLLNIFRRKSVKIGTLTLASEPGGYSLLALVETAEAEVEHLFNFLRRTEGVRHVTCYRHEPSSNASLVFMDAGADASRAARLLAAFPGSKLVFANQGKLLLEVPASAAAEESAIAEAGGIPFSQVMTTRDTPSPELVPAESP
jgi:hypothetical protein